jgi:hypothetical protein
MQVALIPPYNYVAFTGIRPMQMILPSLLKNTFYRIAYSPKIMNESFVILDNGMYEDNMMSNENLIELVDRWQVDELVMPDVREDMNGTLEATDTFLNMYEQVQLDKEPSLMAVIQVEREIDIPEFIKRMIGIEHNHFGPNKFSWGIPRRLVEKFGPHIRMHIVDTLEEMAPEYPIHLLGYARNGDHPNVFNEVRALAWRVRSIDTDAPFVWACHDADIRMDSTPHERPSNYDGLISIDRNLIRTNIKALDAWASGR